MLSGARVLGRVQRQAGHCGRFVDLNWLTEWIEKGKSVGAAG